MSPLSRLVRGFRNKSNDYMTRPDCAVVYNLINAHTYTYTPVEKVSYTPVERVCLLCRV